MCACPYRDHYFSLEACMLRILHSSLLNKLMFNSIIIICFILIADEASKWRVLQFYAWGFALDASWSLSASIIYIGLTSQTASAKKNTINTRHLLMHVTRWYCSICWGWRWLAAKAFHHLCVATEVTDGLDILGLWKFTKTVWMKKTCLFKKSRKML